jgi:hypothetical protein
LGQSRRAPVAAATAASIPIYKDEEELVTRHNSATFVPQVVGEDAAEDAQTEVSAMEIDGEPKRKNCVEPGSMEDILTDCSPGKEEGIVRIHSSPERQQESAAAAAATNAIFDDGFGLDTLATIREDSETESPKFDLTALLSKKIILPSHLESSALFQQPCDGRRSNLPAPSRPLEPPPPRCGRAHVGGGSVGGFKRPLFRRALSMLDPPSASTNNSPVSRGGFDLNIPRFKRPIPPSSSSDGGVQPSVSKRRKCSPSSLERSSWEEEAARGEEDSGRPKFHRSHSENELSIMKSCQLKEEVENILPDSSRYGEILHIPFG